VLHCKLFQLAFEGDQLVFHLLQGGAAHLLAS
jgi:hypothetical protein